MRNTFSHHQTTEPEVMQPTEHCIQMLMYIDILSSRVPSSPGTPYHQLYVKVSTIDQFQAGLGSITLPVLSQGRIQGGGGGAHPARAPPPPLKLEKNMIFWRKIVIFHTKYPNNFRASLRNWKKYDFLA